MKQETNTEHYQPAQLDFISPSLGHFVVTGSVEELQAQQTILEREYGSQTVRPSTMDRVLSGKRVRRLNLF